MKVKASKLARIMSCAGYLFLDHERIENDETFADEGIAASEYLEKLILGHSIPFAASNGVPFCDEIKFYVNQIYQDIKDRSNGHIDTEVKVNWNTQVGVPVKARYDIAFVDKNGTLCIEDLKYGFRIVEAENNWQLLAYAIGEVIRRGQVFEKISMKIHQPRAHHEKGTTREWLISYDQLLGYKNQIENRIKAIYEGERTLQTSEHCRYCEKAAESCTAFNRLFHASLEESTTFLQDQLSDELISRQLDIIVRAKEAISIKEDSLKELAISRIKKGRILPNYTHTEKYSNRSWKKGITPEAISIMTNGVDITEKKVMSPFKAEKAGVAKELVEQLTERRTIGFKLTRRDASEIGNEIFGDVQPSLK